MDSKINKAKNKMSKLLDMLLRWEYIYLIFKIFMHWTKREEDYNE